MKVGDKLYCKKNYIHNKDILFHKDKEYIIEDMWYIDEYEKKFGLKVWKEIDEKHRSAYVPSNWIAIIGTPCESNKSVRHFSLIKMGVCNYVYEYFKSVAEVRREKLKKIF